MARKPASELSPAYARRLARAQAAGKSRQEARGHRAGEHVVRRLGGARKLSPTQRQDAERLAAALKGKRGAARRAEAERQAKLAKRRERDRRRHEREKVREKFTGQLTAKDRRYAEAEGVRKLLGLYTEKSAKQKGVERMIRLGPERFREAVKENRAAQRQYLREMRAGTWESRGEDLLDMWAEHDDEPDTIWYYYHS